MRLSPALLGLSAFAFLPVPAPLLSQSLPQAVPRLDLRVDGVESDFSRIVHLAVSRDGDIVVAQPDDGYLLVFDSLGNQTGRFGRIGNGPGEFQSIGIFRGWLGHEFWQSGALNRRISLWRLPDSLAGEFVLGQRSAGSARESPGIGRLLLASVAGILPDSSILVAGPFLPAKGDEGWAAQVDTAAYMLLHSSPSGIVHRVVAQWPALGAGCQEIMKGQRRPVPECETWFWSIAPDASRITSVIIEADPPGKAALQLTVIDPRGRVLVRRRMRVPAVPLTRADADSIRNRRIERTKIPGFREVWQNITLPKMFRPVTRLVAGRDGTTWLRIRTSREKHQYLVLDRTGDMLGWVDMPENFRLEVAEEGTLWGTEENDDGIESVVRYRIEWGAAGAR